MENINDYVVKNPVSSRAINSKKIVSIQEQVPDQKDFLDNIHAVNSKGIHTDVEPVKTEIITLKNQGKIFSEIQSAGQVIYLSFASTLSRV